jgi:ATP:ADP antiporter, AAA family
MQNRLYKALGIEAEESGKMTLLLIMGFFMGMFIACLSVAAQSLFLVNFSSQKELALAFVISGAFALTATFVYNFLQSRIPFILLGASSLLTIIVLTGFVEFGGGYFTDPQTINYFGFTQILPFTFITLLVFWGSFGRLFNLRQAKRLLGSVDAGFLIASIIAFFSIPQILAIKGVETETLYTISLVSVVCYFLLFLLLSGKYLSKGLTLSQEKERHKKIGTFAIFKNRYVLYLSLFAIITMVALRFIDFSFLQTTQIYFDKEYVPVFLSYYEAVVVIFSFLFQILAADKIVAMYGMRVASFINPILTGLFTVAALFLGLTFGYTEAAGESFVIFFIMIAMSKLVVQATREALDEPVMKLYMLPVDSEHRLDVQTKLEGTILSIGNLLAGGLIFLTLTVELTKLIYFTLFALPMFIIWYFVANKLNFTYRQTLQGALSKSKLRAAETKNERTFTVNNVLEREVNSSLDEKVIYGLKLMEKLEPALFETSLIRLVDSDVKKVREFARTKITALGIDQDLNQNTEVRSLALQALGESQDSDLLSISPDKLLKLSKSNKSADRILGAKLLRKLISQRTIFILLELLRDVDPKVRFEALLTARKAKRPETWSVLIELLSSPAYGNHAAAALVEAGEDVLPALDTAFHKSSQSDWVMLRIVQIIGRIGTPAAIELLWKKADYPDKRIVKQILYTLRYINYRASGREVQEVMTLIDDEIGKTIWNLAAITELPKEEHFQYLRAALKEEVTQNFDQLTLLLSLLYDPQSIQLVRENIDSGDPDGITFALELMDIFVDNDLKPKLFPLFDDKPVLDKLRDLQIYYPRENYNPIQVINYVLNRDFNQNNRWSKVCAVHATAYLADFRVSRGLIAQLFNRDKLLQETAAWVIYNKDKNAYATVVNRLPLKDKKFLDGSIENNQLLDGLDDGFFLGIEMVLFIKELPVFKNIPGVLLSDLADKITPIELRAGEKLSFPTNSIDTPLFIVAHGEVNLINNGSPIAQLKKTDVYGELFQDGSAEEADTIQARERSIVFKISLTDFYFIMATHHELVQGIAHNISELQATRKPKTIPYS